MGTAEVKKHKPTIIDRFKLFYIARQIHYNRVIISVSIINIKEIISSKTRKLNL